MKHLLKIVTDSQSMKVSAKASSPGNIFRSNSRYLCYKISGYWFRLNHTQWARYRGINPNTLSARISEGRSIGQVLGFDKVIHRMHARGKNERL